MNVALANFTQGTHMDHHIDYALELFDTDRDLKAVRFRLIRDLKITREEAEKTIQQVLDSRSKAANILT